MLKAEKLLTASIRVAHNASFFINIRLSALMPLAHLAFAMGEKDYAEAAKSDSCPP